MPLLDELEEDAFKELFNLSFGRAAATLSEMVDAEVTVSPPCFSVLPVRSVGEHIHTLYGLSSGLVAMRFGFLFPGGNRIPGMAVLMIRSAQISGFLDALYGSHIPEETAGQVEQEAMQLAGDLLLYTCTSSLSALFASEIDSDKPQYYKGVAEDLPDHLALDEAQCSDGGESGPGEAGERQMLLMRVDFSLLGKDVAGSLLIWMDGEGLPCLKAGIDRLLRGETLSGEPA